MFIYYLLIYLFIYTITAIFRQHGLAFPDITTDEDSSSSKENVFRKRTMTINESMEFVDIGTAQSNSSDNEDSHDGLKSFDSTAQTTSKSDKIRTSVTHSRVIQARFIRSCSNSFIYNLLNICYVAAECCGRIASWRRVRHLRRRHGEVSRVHECTVEAFAQSVS